MTAQRWAILLTAILVQPITARAQTMRAARTVWASDPAEVPALASEIDRLLRTGELVLSRVERDTYFEGRTHERLDQFHRGVRVFGGQIVWEKDGGRIVSITGNLYPGISLDVGPALDAAQAAGRAIGGRGGLRVAGATELVVLPLRDGYVLAYYLHLRGNASLEAVFVDARSGEVLLRYNDLRSQSSNIELGIGTWQDRKKMTAEPSGGTSRAVDVVRPFGIKTYDVSFDFNAWNTYNAATDFFLARDGDGTWEDGAVVDAHVYAGYTYDYYFKRHGRRGIDDRGLAAINFVHIVRQSAGFNNAFFDPIDNSMNYGDGDGRRFNFFSSAIDVVAHELTHAVTQFSSDLIYLNESGALNEAFSDIMSAGVEFMFEPPGRGRQKADWVLGEDIFMGFGPVFRSFENPNALGDPDHYDVRCLPPRCSEDFDNGGVHINSSIANHAFYLMVEGGRNRISGMTVNGIGREKMGDIESIFYRAFTAYLVPSSGFSQAREATLRAARELFGAGSPEENVVRQGWNAVGVP